MTEKIFCTKLVWNRAGTMNCGQARKLFWSRPGVPSSKSWVAASWSPWCLRRLCARHPPSSPGGGGQARAG